MSSDADIEKALVKKSVELRCSSLSLSLALAAAAVCILAVPCAAAASYTKAALGAQWALIRAEATDKGTTPQAITIGMFRICYESPIVSCLPFQWGLDLDPTSFKGGDAWRKVLPSALMVQAWSGLSAAAFLLTFMASFTFCRCAPTQFVWILGVITTLVDLAYFGITSGLYFLMRTRITSLTTYTPKPVQATLIAYIVTVCLLLLVALGAFVSHETDTSEQEWRRWRRKKEEDEAAKDQALHFQLWNTRAWVNRKFAYGMGQPRWQQILFTGGRAALFRHYGANNWKNPYETDEDLKKEVEQVAAFRAEWVEFNDDDKAVVDEAVVEQQISDIELTRDREKLEKKRILGDISDKEYWETRRKLEKKRAKVKASKVQRANIAKKMENIADTDAVSEDTKKEFVMLQRFQLLALSRAGRRLDPRQMDFLKRTRHLAEPQKPVAPANPEVAATAQQDEGLIPNTANALFQEPLQTPHNPYQQMRDAFGRLLPIQQPRGPVQAPSPPALQAGTEAPQLLNGDAPSLTNPPADTSAPSRSVAASTAPSQVPAPIPGSSSIQASASAISGTAPVKDMAVAAATAFAARKFANNKQGSRPNLAKAAMSASAGIQKHRKSAAFRKPNARFLAGVAGDVLGMTVMMAAHHEKSGIKIAKDFVKAQGAVDMAALANLTQKRREPVPVIPQASPLRLPSPMALLPETPESPPLRLPMPAPVHTRRVSPPLDHRYIKPLKKVVATKLVPRLRSPQREEVHRQRSPSPVTPRAPSPPRPPVMRSERPASPQQVKPAARFANAVQTLLPVNAPAAPQRLLSPQPAPITEAAPRPVAMHTGQQVQPEQRKIAALPNMPFPGVSELMKSIPLLEVKKATKTVPPRSDTEEILVLSASRLPQDKDEGMNGTEPQPKLPGIPGSSRGRVSEGRLESFLCVRTMRNVYIEAMQIWVLRVHAA